MDGCALPLPTLQFLGIGKILPNMDEMHLEPQQTEISVDPCPKPSRPRQVQVREEGNRRRTFSDPVRPTAAVGFLLKAHLKGSFK